MQRDQLRQKAEEYILRAEELKGLAPYVANAAGPGGAIPTAGGDDRWLRQEKRADAILLDAKTQHQEHLIKEVRPRWLPLHAPSSPHARRGLHTYHQPAACIADA